MPFQKRLFKMMVAVVLAISLLVPLVVWAENMLNNPGMEANIFSTAPIVTFGSCKWPTVGSVL